jgi:hypothetical protein
MEKGITVNVLRNAAYDSTLDGLTSKKARVLLVGPGVAEKHEATNEDDFLILKTKRSTRYQDEIYYYAVPASLENANGVVCFGGNYIVCSKENGNVTNHPIPVHDRCESYELYDKLSR